MPLSLVHQQGCRCRECFGLAEFMHRLTGKDYGLPRAPGHSSLLPEELDPCDKTLTCGCARCESEREQRRAIALKRISQPWEPKRRAA